MKGIVFMFFMGILPYFLLLISLIFIGMASFVFFLKKPLIINSIWLIIISSLCFLPQILFSLKMLFIDPSLISLLPFLMFAFLIVMFVFVMKGYTIYGADGTDFEKMLLECLVDNGYEYEQSLSTLKIKNPEIELSIAVQAWVGTAQIKVKGKNNNDLLKNLIINLRNKQIKSNYIFPIFYAFIGVLIFLLSISLILS